MQRDHVACGEELLFARRRRVAIGARLCERLRARPHENTHAKRPAVAGHDAADAAIAVNAERLAAQRRTDADLPLPGFECGDVLRDEPQRIQDQPEGQFRRGVRRCAGMLARRDDDAEPRAGIDVDMRIDAALADQPQLGQLLKERRADLRPLAEQHQDLGILQALGKDIRVLHMVGPHRDVMAIEFPETLQRAQRVEIIVENGDFHGMKTTSGRWEGNNIPLNSYSPIAITALKKKTGPLRARFSSSAWGRRRHLPEGNNCKHRDCQSGRISSNRALCNNPDTMRFARRPDNAALHMSAMRYGQVAAFSRSRHYEERKRRSNPAFSATTAGLLRSARNDAPN